MTTRYRAFLSYSHSDHRVAMWLHRALERYHIPAKLIGRVTALGPVPPRIRPVFRDRDELPASSDLGAAIATAIEGSRSLIVVCSPAAATSRWVNEEILTFKRRYGEAHVLAVIVAGEPYGSASPDTSERECFPPALRFRLGADGALSTDRTEPIAADLREGGDGRALVRLKLVAGLTGLELDDLVQREAQRRVRRATWIAAGAVTGMFLAGTLAWYANEQRLLAERESATARAASDFLVGTFVLSNPATQNPKTITALSILDRSAERARRELADQPVVQARLVSTLGEAFNNLGLFEQSRDALERAAPAIARAGSDGANAQLTLAITYLELGTLAQALSMVRRAETTLGPDGPPATRARAAITEGMIHTAAADVQAGLAAYDRALLIYRTHPQFGGRNVASALENRGNLLSDDGQFVAADDALREALGINRRLLGDAHLATGQSWFLLAQNAFLAGEFVRAEERIARALAIQRRVLDADNNIVADGLSLQGQILHGLKRLTQARQSLQQAIAIYRTAFRGPHYLIGIAEVYLALVESEQGATAEALRMLDDAKRNYDGSYGKLHANHGDLLINRATVLARVGRRTEALADCAAGLKILDGTLGAQSRFTASMRRTCARI